MVLWVFLLGKEGIRKRQNNPKNPTNSRFVVKCEAVKVSDAIIAHRC